MNEVELIQAIRSEDIETVKSLLKENADIFKAVTVRTPGGFASETAVAIEFAAESKNKDILPLLIQQNPEINIPKAIKHQVFGYMSLLMWVAAYGVIDNVDLLLEYNADINAKDTVGFTALMHAVLIHAVRSNRTENDRTEMVRHLLKLKQIDMTATDELGRNVLHHVDSTDMLTLLLNYPELRGIINHGDNDGDTPLAVFASVREIELVQVLLERGADPNVKNRKGKTARDVVIDRLNKENQDAIKSEYQAVIDLLDTCAHKSTSTNSPVLTAFSPPGGAGSLPSNQVANDSNLTLTRDGCIIS